VFKKTTLTTGKMKMRKKLVAGLTTGLLMLGIGGMANATVTQWTTGSGANNHWYDVITTTSSITWEDARNSLSSNWHLVTITSAEEDLFVSNLLYSQRTTRAENYWLGACRTFRVNH
jgi:hypothetical protein